jgi:hypothetical protein
MNKFFLILVILTIGIASCDKTVFKKPEKLIPRKKMINILADIHIAESTFNSRRYQDTLLYKSESSHFYYSILKKYGYPDTVFEKSYVYYAGDPKNFEKLYRDVINILNEKEQYYSEKNKEAIDLNKQNEQ